MKIDEIVKSLAGAQVTGPLTAEVTGVTCDSRHVRPGHVFVAIPGTRKDGHHFVPDALQRGAVAIVAEHEVQAPLGICRIRVGDAREAAADVAAAFFGHPSRRLIMAGVTGTNGKTTTTYMLRDMLRAAGRQPGLIGTVNYEVGARQIPASRTTPETTVLQGLLAQMVSAGCQSAVMEVSSHALSQKRAHAIDFDVAVFTNLTQDHLDYHGTMQAYFEAKSLLFRQLGGGVKAATAVVNLDDEWGRRLAVLDGLRVPVLTYGVAAGAQVRAVELQVHSRGTVFVAEGPWGRQPVNLRLLGRFNVSNALAAMAAGGALGLAPDLMAKALGGMVGVPGRLEEVSTGRDFQVFVDYAHTDDALHNVLLTLREITAGRLIVVFGCGGDRDRAKRSLMGGVVARLADFAIITSDNPRSEPPASIIAQVREGFGGSDNVDAVEDRAQAIGRAIAMAQPGDVVLIAGKGHEAFQEFADTIIPFDDRQVARKFLP